MRSGAEFGPKALSDVSSTVQLTMAAVLVTPVGGSPFPFQSIQIQAGSLSHASESAEPLSASSLLICL